MAPIPPVPVHRRLDRLAHQRVRSGHVGIGATAALADVGFEPVSEVMGATSVVAPARSFFGPAGSRMPRGWQGGPGAPPPVHLSSTQPRRLVPAHVTALRAGTATVLDRLVQETRAVGGDGVVDLQVEHTEHHEDGQATTWRLLATGTAIRSTGRRHTDQPFTSAMSATQTVQALRNGWVPLAYLFCPVAAMRWVDDLSFRQRQRRAPNGEVDAYTETVAACRRQAVADFSAAATKVGADAAVVATTDLVVGTQPSLAEAYVLLTGTALLHRPVPRRPRAVPVLSLKDLS